MFRSNVAVVLLVLASVALGCKRSAEDEARRRATDRAAIAESYRSLSFMVPLVDRNAPPKAVDCDDASLPQHAKRSGRSCKRLHTVDASTLKMLFGDGSSDAGESATTRWMRRRAFAQLVPQGAVSSRLDELKVLGALKDLERDFIGVFVDGPTSNAARFVGSILIVDVEHRRVRCEAPLDLDLAPSSPHEAKQRRDDRMLREVDKALGAITKNFCID